MAVQQGTASFNGSGVLNGTARARQIVAATFNGSGALSATARAQQIIRPWTFAGAGSLSCRLPARTFITARFAGSGGLSAIDSVISIQVNIVCTSSLEAVVSNPLATLVGDPKHRLVLAVEIDMLPLE
jgi:hypothetical protein